MQRRQFIKIMTTGTAGTILIPTLLSTSVFADSGALEGWHKPPLNRDIRIVLLSYAILAANPHNKQPWLIDLGDSNQFDLYVDQSRLLPETDPPFRQVHIGQGTFLENLSIAAGAHGYEAKITYFPSGMYSNTNIENKPIASVTLEKKEMAVDPLFSQILNRQSNKRVYEEQRLTEKQINILKATFNSSEFDFHFTQEPGLVKEIAMFMGKAMEIETTGDQRHIETAKMFRLNSDEVEKYRDGFSLAQMGMTGIKGWVAETFFLGSREEEEDPNSEAAKTTKKITIEKTVEQAESTPAFGWIVSKKNTRLDQVKVGEIYQRVNLLSTKLGIAQHPMSQILQEYSEMKALQHQFLKKLNIPESHTIQMLFRLGNADAVPHTPRRKISDMMKG